MGTCACVMVASCVDGLLKLLFLLCLLFVFDMIVAFMWSISLIVLVVYFCGNFTLGIDFLVAFWYGLLVACLLVCVLVFVVRLFVLVVRCVVLLLAM